MLPSLLCTGFSAIGVGVNCAPPKKYVQVLLLSTCGCERIWKKSLQMSSR